MDAQAKRRALPANRRADRQRRARWVEEPPQWLEPAPDAPQGRRRVRTLFLSDTHLGTRGCKAEFLLDFLRKHDCQMPFQRFRNLSARLEPGAAAEGAEAQNARRRIAA